MVNHTSLTSLNDFQFHDVATFRSGSLSRATLLASGGMQRHESIELPLLVLLRMVVHRSAETLTALDLRYDYSPVPVSDCSVGPPQLTRREPRCAATSHLEVSTTMSSL
jgi:hypothetical protein